MVSQSGTAVRIRKIGDRERCHPIGGAGLSGLALCMVLLAVGLIPSTAQASGQEVFSQQCASCHALDSESLVGPGLEGVVEQRDRDWLIRKISEPDSLSAEGDPITEELVSEYGSEMPNLGVSAADAESIVDFLGDGDPDADAAVDLDFTPEQIEEGGRLFEGAQRFENRGVSCNACHDVHRDDVFGGGSLAADLTDYGAQGVDALLHNPPFPEMEVAYEDRPLTDNEIESLQAFLHDVEQNPDDPRPPGGIFFASGLLGMVILIGLCSVVWRGRRRESVNQDIYDRQIKSR